VRLTGQSGGNPRWSPDGGSVAFESLVNGQWDVYRVNHDGGRLLRLTSDPAEDAMPSWSRDGRWIYFTSTRGGARDVWKMPAGGGAAVRLNVSGGAGPVESPDGKWLYCVPRSGGTEEKLVEGVMARAFDPVEDGVYFIGSWDGVRALRYLRLSDGAVSTVQPLAKSGYDTLTVSPDRRAIVYAQLDSRHADLMLIENFP
jgi:dipeptidyl aminopeptidase/acylaminoacyl peptidase